MYLLNVYQLNCTYKNIIKYYKNINLVKMVKTSKISVKDLKNYHHEI